MNKKFSKDKLETIVNKLLNKTIPAPISGTLSGHAAGEPFDKYVYKILGENYNNIFRQYEYLNHLYSKNSHIFSAEGRHQLIPYLTLRQLLNRGNKTTNDWSLSNQFEEKQNDTADILHVEDNNFVIIDVKTFNMDKLGQPPNIISSYKLAKACKNIIQMNEYDILDIIYIGIHWELSDNQLICKKSYWKELFKSEPSNLYINHAAALQIQFHVDDLDQSFKGSQEDWCRSFLNHYLESYGKRINRIKKKFIEPFIL